MLKPAENYKVFGVSHKKGVNSDLKFHSHYQYEIFILHHGDCKYAIGNNIFQLEPGDIVIMDGSLMHRAFLFSDERFYERSIVQFSSDWIYPVLRALKGEYLLDKFETNHYSILRGKDPSRLKILDSHIQRIENYIQEESTISHYDMELKLEIVHLLLDLHKMPSFEGTNEILNMGEKYTYVQEAIQYIQNNFTEGFSLDDVADDLSISKSYLVNIFKEITGSTVMEYAMNYRLKQAMHMLVAYPDLRNKDVCYSCGFTNESHFSRYFKNNVGVTPGEFRKANFLDF